MKKHIFAAAAAIAMSVIPTTNAHAEYLDGSRYVGVGLGAYGLELKGTNGATLNQKNTVFGGYLKLGRDFGDYLGAELRIGATGSGKKTYSFGTIKLQSPMILSYLGKVQFPVTPDFRVYGLLGGTTAKVKLTYTTGGTSGTATKTGFTYGAGLQYFVQDSVSLGAEWVQYWTNVKTGVDSKMKIWGATATASFHF